MRKETRGYQHLEAFLTVASFETKTFFYKSTKHRNFGVDVRSWRLNGCLNQTLSELKGSSVHNSRVKFAKQRFDVEDLNLNIERGGSWVQPFPGEHLSVPGPAPI